MLFRSRPVARGQHAVSVDQGVVKVTGQKNALEFAQSNHTFLFWNILPHIEFLQRRVKQPGDDQGQDGVGEHVGAVVRERVEIGLVEHRAQDLRRSRCV